MSLRLLAVAFVLGAPLIAASCTKAQETAVTTAALPVCEVVLDVADPSLAPLCTTAEAIAQAVEALVAEAQTAIVDAGAIHVTALVIPAKPTPRQVYDWLVAHGARPVDAGAP